MDARQMGTGPFFFQLLALLTCSFAALRQLRCAKVAATASLAMPLSLLKPEAGRDSSLRDRQGREEAPIGSLTDIRRRRNIEPCLEGLPISCLFLRGGDRCLLSRMAPFAQGETQLFVLLCERCRRRHEDTCIAPRMRINEIYEQDASSPAARGGVKPTCVSITAGSFLERTHRRVRCDALPQQGLTVHGTAGDPSRVVGTKVVSVWRLELVLWPVAPVGWKHQELERHGRGNLLRPPLSPRLAADAPKGTGACVYGRSRHPG